MKKIILMALLLWWMTAGLLYGQGLAAVEYYVDTDPGPGMGTRLSFPPGDTLQYNFSLPLTGLSPGWHQLFFRACDTSGIWGISLSRTFYVYETTQAGQASPVLPMIAAECFFDTDPGAGLGIPITFHRSDTVDLSRYLPVSGLVPGNHKAFIRVKAEDGNWSLARGIAFTVTESGGTLPVPDFTFDTVTYGTPVSFTNLSDSLVPAALHKWDMDNNGSVDYTTHNVTHAFSTPGYHQVKLTVENAPTLAASVIKEVVAGPLPSVQILVTGNTSFCLGDSVILTSNNAPPDFTYEWSTGDTTRAITVKQSGSYFVWVTNQYGVIAKSQTIAVTVHEWITANLSLSHATGGLANGRAEVTASGGSGPIGYTWNNGASTAINDNLLPGNYTVSISDGHCPVMLGGVIVNLPVEEGDLVRAEYFIDQDPGVGQATDMVLRSGDTIEFPFTVDMGSLPAGRHRLYVRTQDTYGIWGMAMEREIFVIDTAAPAVLPKPPLSEIEYFVDTDPGVGHGIAVPVSTVDSLEGLFTMPLTGLAPGYHVLFYRVRDTAGCWGNTLQKPFFLYETNMENLVQNQKSIKKAEYFFDNDPGSGNAQSISFNVNDTVDIIRYIPVQGLAAGTHRVYIRCLDENGQWSHWQRNTFTVNSVVCTCPQVDFDADTVFALGGTTHFVNTSSQYIPEASFEWDVDYDGTVDYTTANVNHVYTDYGIYLAKLTIKNSDICFASVLKEVVVSPAVDTLLVVSGPTAFCFGDSVTITAQPGNSYHWSSGQTSQSITVKQSGDYSVRLDNPYGVQAYSRTVHVEVYELPVVQVATIDATGGHANGTAYCTATGGTGNYTYLWSTGGSLRIENNLAEGDYWLTTSDGRCPDHQTFHIYNLMEEPGDIVGAEYYFDIDPGVGNANPLNISAGDTCTFATPIPITGVSAGYHWLYIRAMDTYQHWGLVLSQKVYVYDTAFPTYQVQSPICQAEYFIDADPGVGNGMAYSFSASDTAAMMPTIDLGGLATGYHRLYMRAKDLSGRWGIPVEKLFYIYDTTHHAATESAKIVAAEYFYDTDPGAGLGSEIDFSPTGDQIELDRFVPVAGLMEGNHNLYVRVMDESGAWSLYNKQAITVDPITCTMPVPDFVYDTVEFGNSTNLVSTSTNVLPSSFYYWDVMNDGSVDFTGPAFAYTFPQPGVYDVKLLVYNSLLCQAAIVKQVFVGPLPSTNVNYLGDLVFCEGDSVVLMADSGYTYLWYPSGETTQSIVVKTSQTNYVWVSNAWGMETRSEALITSVHPIPELEVITINATGGLNNGSAYAVVTGGSGIYNYTWSSGSTVFYANDLLPGTYSVEVDDGHCPVYQIFNIENLPLTTNGIIAAEYFFNTDPGVGNGQPINISQGDTVIHMTGISLLGLPLGYHYLYVRTKSTDHQWSLCTEKQIYVFDTLQPNSIDRPPLESAEYFTNAVLDENVDPGVYNGSPITIIEGDTVESDIYVSSMNFLPGFYRTYIRAKDTSGQWGHVYRADFYVYDTTYINLMAIQPEIVAAEYFYDTDPGVGMGIQLPITPGDEVNFTGYIPLEATPPGPHFLYVRVKDANEQWSIYSKTPFMVFECTQPNANFTISRECVDNPVVFNDLSQNVHPSATYEWDVNNDGMIDYTSKGSIVHTYFDPDEYECRLTIRHNVACVSTIVKAIRFPNVTLGNDTTIYTDQFLILDAGSGYTQYIWNTGDTTQTLLINGSVVSLGVDTFNVNVADSLNCTASDTIVVNIQLPPRDLIVENISISSHSIAEEGENILVSCRVRNTGSISTSSSILRLYLSLDTLISGEDIVLADRITDLLEANSFQDFSLSLHIPPANPGDSIMLLFKTDATELIVEENESNNVSVEQLHYIITPYKQLIGKVYLEGLLNTNTLQMNKALNSLGCFWPDSIADILSIRLHGYNNPELVFYQSDSIMLSQNGVFICRFPESFSGEYFLEVSHRNSIQTWSSLPIIIGQEQSFYYDFTISAAMAWGNNMTNFEGLYMLFSGDINQDGQIDALDIISMDNSSSSGILGFRIQDLNGDGYVNTVDMEILLKNSNEFIKVQMP